MWILPMSLRARMAAVTLLGIFFVPFATSDLRGLTHVLSCQDEVATSLYISKEDAGVAVGSATSVTREQVEDVGLGLCGGLEVALELQTVEGDKADVLIAVTNTTRHRWVGSLEVRFDDASVPVAIGSIDPGATATDVVEASVVPGASYSIDATLRIGP